MYHQLQDYFKTPKVPKNRGFISPLSTKPVVFNNLVPGSVRKNSNRDVLVMNSTAKCPEENSPNISCEISSINATVDVMPPQTKSDIIQKISTETPAKIFARMKAKVQRQGSTEIGASSDCLRNMELFGGVFSNPDIQHTQKKNSSQETYVLAVSPPRSDNGDAQSEEMELSEESSSIRKAGKPLTVLTTETQSFIEPYVLLEKMPVMLDRRQDTMKVKNFVPCVLLEKLNPDETMTQLKQKPMNYVNKLKDFRNKGNVFVFAEKSISPEKGLERDLQAEQPSSPKMDLFGKSVSQMERSTPNSKAPRPIANLLDDPLLQLSPRVLLPKKQQFLPKSKHQAGNLDVAVDKDADIEGIHLRNWILKLLDKDLMVDGVRTDSNIPWHSSAIIERLSDNVLKTSSGRTYILIGKMGKCSKSPFPSWFLKKFLIGFPIMWKEHLNLFLSGHAGSDTTQKDTSVEKPPKARVQINSTKVHGATTPSITSSDRVLQGSGKVSRSGRVIKPPLDFWKGGRIVLDSEMNVTVHQDYASILTTPKRRQNKATCRVMEKQPPRHETQARSKTSSSENELSVPKRKIKHQSKRKASSISNPLLNECTGLTKPAKVSPILVSELGDDECRNVTRASLRNRLSEEDKSTVESASERSIPLLRKGRKTVGQQETWLNSSLKTKNSRSPFKQDLVEAQNGSSLYQSSRLRSRSQTFSDSGSSFTSPDLPKGRREKKSTSHKPLKPIVDFSCNSLLQRGQEITRGSRDKKVISLISSEEDVFAFSLKKDAERPNYKNAPLSSKRFRKQGKKSQQKAKWQPSSSENSGVDENEPKNPELRETRSKKPLAEKVINKEKDELLDEKWTEEELQKLEQAVKSFRKHKGGYWSHVAHAVGTRSAEECYEQHNISQRTNRIPIKRASKKPTVTTKTGKETVEITAKAGTLKMKQQMRHFLEHLPKDDRDDLFASSPVHRKPLKLPTFTSHELEDFTQLQNPQTPNSWMSTSAKTPQCLHISPGMVGSINKNNMDKYIFHLQKNQKGRRLGKKALPMGALTPAPVVKKTKKRCVAEDEDFVVWNMLSDKDVPSREEGSEDEEDDYFMEYY